MEEESAGSSSRSPIPEADVAEDGVGDVEHRPAVAAIAGAREREGVLAGCARNPDLVPRAERNPVAQATRVVVDRVAEGLAREPAAVGGDIG